MAYSNHQGGTKSLAAQSRFHSGWGRTSCSSPDHQTQQVDFLSYQHPEKGLLTLRRFKTPVAGGQNMDLLPSRFNQQSRCGSRDPLSPYSGCSGNLVGRIQHDLHFLLCRNSTLFCWFLKNHPLDQLGIFLCILSQEVAFLIATISAKQVSALVALTCKEPFFCATQELGSVEAQGHISSLHQDFVSSFSVLLPKVS